MPVQATARYGHREQVSVLELAGELRYQQAPALRSFVDQVLLADGADTVILDLRRLACVDSTGLGLLARVGRATLERHARRAVILRPPQEVALCLRAAAFEVLFLVLDEPPFDAEVALAEVPLAAGAEAPLLGGVVLDAHRDLAELSDGNKAAYADVIATLDAQLEAKRRKS